MGLTDEIMDLVKQYGRCCWRAGAFEDVQRRCDESGRGDLLGVSIYSRLSALEQELETLRAHHAAEIAFDALLASDASIRYCDQMTAQVLGRAGLPCTSEYLSAQTGFNGEEGG